MKKAVERLFETVLSDTVTLFAQGVDHIVIAQVFKCPRKYRTFTSGDIDC